ncbi:response regulator transcription factor [Thalassotalea sp. LPB0316]|uniref:LytR/AlgR family response regulator transcription factor n=1 Tax=Thalassotalea sp. LPB0316 TaxID=2769490 RepID=UPI001866E3F7|nr:LytTR family DNA-binding domain-containing protein [Thalassotalea sp. LPB0316]QOL24880.1 response regulator transcription factor [Thalassotalea sp. LPB0316]
MDNQLTTIIVDDEPLARKGLRVRLSKRSDINIVAECSNGREAINAVRELAPDLLFLDIQMPGMTGFDVLEALVNEQIPLPNIVFVTAFDQYALKAFEVHALDYLLKPADEQRIDQAIEKVKQSIQSNIDKQHKDQLLNFVSDVTGNDYQQLIEGLEKDEISTLSSYSDILPIKDAGEVSRVAVKTIMWIDAAGDYMCVHTTDTTHILRKTMKELEESLDPRQFIRCHRSIIVNKHFIAKFCSQVNGEYYLVMKNDKELKVSRSYKDKVKKAVIS